LAPGEVVKDLSEEDISDPHNAALIEEGTLMSLDEAANPDATDSAAQLAEENGVNLAEITGTGVGGRITKEDVERHLAETSEQEGGRE
jgi:pyruvate/2-oxoglutarate dehydrogenase complex dihydrolipoamide acyltransferase (E2) component